MTLDSGKLRDRLRSVVGSVMPPAASAAPLQAPVPIASDIGAVEAEAALEQALGGGWRHGDEGRAFMVRRRVPPDARHGRSCVADFAEAIHTGMPESTLLAPGGAALPLLFFDLETTGLSGGAGTHAFLVGCGWFDADGGFVTEQHLLVDYASERGMLALVARDLTRGGAIVSFNGKSFDAPVLESRYAFHRLAFPVQGRPHLDVLHPSRRFWGGVDEEGCSLGVLERRVLGATRVGDVAGAEIPSRYFRFVRTGDASVLSEVLEHNRVDLLSLAGVTARLFWLIASGADATSSAREALALGWIYRRGDRTERAAEAFERAIRLASEQRCGGRLGADPAGADAASGAHAANRALVAEAVHALALMARRSRRHADAAARWQQLLEVPGCPPSLTREAAEALAIHHEHRARDLAAARMFALKTLEEGTNGARSDAVRHRLARIERKMISERRLLFPSSP
ncbi:MAG: ribonuclease H-like domain-containing protein [Vicinamibacterales bacterium]